MPGQEFELKQETLPLKLLQRITLFLRRPIDKFNLGLAAKFLGQAAYDASYLKSLITLHFPRYISALDLENEEKIDWIQHYRLAYRDSFSWMADHMIELFFKVKEGDLAGLQATNINFQDLLQEDNHGIDLYEWAQRLGRQNILDHFYSLAVNFFLNEQKESYFDITILTYAIICFQPLEEINRLITHSVKAEKKEEELIDALYAATNCGNVEVVKHLLGLLSEEIKSNELPLLMPKAIVGGHYQVVEVFLNTKYIDITNELLFQACEYGHLDIVNLFLIHLEAKLVPDDFDGVLLQAISKSMNNDQDVVVEKLLAKIKNPQIINSVNTPSLPRQAAELGAFKVLKKLLNAPFKIDIHRTETKLTPLENAVLKGHYRIVKLLLDNGALDHLPLLTKDKPLFVAVQSGSSRMDQLFLFSVMVDDLEMMRVFLNYKPEVIRARSGNNESALRIAVQKGHLKIIVELLIRGAVIDWIIKEKAPFMRCAPRLGISEGTMICHAIRLSKLLSPSAKELLYYETDRVHVGFEIRMAETLAKLKSVILQNAPISTLEPYAETINSDPALNKIYQNYLSFIGKRDETYNINKKSIGPSR